MDINWKQISGTRSICSCIIAVAMLFSVSNAIAVEWDPDRKILLGNDWEVELTGYARWMGAVLIDDQPETAGDDSGELAMNRYILQPGLDGKIGRNFRWRIEYRFAREHNTSYLRDLRDLGAAGGPNGNGLPRELYNESEFRDTYIDFNVGQRTNLRLGRQQIAFGETDFFQALDLIHGFDFRWRNFLVPENEDTRKPLNMAVLNQEFGRYSSMQFVAIPGQLNRDQDFGSDFDLSGGRWGVQPFRGVDFLQSGLTPFNRDHTEGDTDDFKGAARWRSMIGPVNYSIAYLHVHNPDPMVNSLLNPFKETPANGEFSEFIFPIIDVLGFTASGYSEMFDAVFSTEIAYTFDKPMNVGRNPQDGCSGFAAPPGVPPGFCGIAEKDMITVMLRGDWVARWTESVFKTSRPGFLSVQLFNDHVFNLSKSDDVVDLGGFSGRKKQDSALLTWIFNLNYRNDRINPGFAGGTDLSNGGGFLLPNVEFQFGDRLRLRGEFIYFWDEGSANVGTVDATRDVHVFGYFDNTNQLFARLTYQF